MVVKNDLKGLKCFPRRPDFLTTWKRSHKIRPGIVKKLRGFSQLSFIRKTFTSMHLSHTVNNFHQGLNILKAAMFKEFNPVAICATKNKLMQKTDDLQEYRDYFYMYLWSVGNEMYCLWKCMTLLLQNAGVKKFTLSTKSWCFSVLIEQN